MKVKEIAIVIGALIVLGFGFNYFDSSKADALIAEEKVRVLELERVKLEEQVEEAAQDYEILKDSLDQAHDSIAEIRTESIQRASDASISFEEGVGVLRDSLEAYEGLGIILDKIEYDHRIEVQAYQEQIGTLEADKALLWQRVEALDSMWIKEQQVNDALRREITALNEEADAWEAIATPSIMRRVSRAVPYVLAGVGIGTLISFNRGPS
jgi:chromosome segregation ATPase